MTDPLRRFARTLVQRLGETPGGPHRAVTVEEVRSRLLPYRGYRAVLGFESFEDYDVVVMRLVGEEGGFVRTLPQLAAERCRAEAESPAPNPELLDQLAEVTIQIGAESLARILEDPVAPPARVAPRSDLDIIERHLELEVREPDEPLMFSPSPPRPAPVSEPPPPPPPPPTPEPRSAPAPAPRLVPVPESRPVPPPGPRPVPVPEPPPVPVPEPRPAPEPPPAPAPPPPPAPEPPPPPAPEPVPAPPPEPRPAPPARPQLKPRRPLAPPPHVEPPPPIPPAAAAPNSPTEPSPPPRVESPSLTPEVAGMALTATAMTCRGCRQSLPGGRKVLFCPWCGARQASVTCPKCNTELDAQWKHCITCGWPVNDPSRLV